MTFMPLTPSVGKEKRILEGPKKSQLQFFGTDGLLPLGDQGLDVVTATFNGWTPVIRHP
jgi:hypothetical protein